MLISFLIILYCRVNAIDLQNHDVDGVLHRRGTDTTNAIGNLRPRDNLDFEILV